MKSLKYIAIILGMAVFASSCDDKDYPAGTPEYDHHYYLVFVPNNNTKVTVQRNQTTLLKLPVQFYSAFTRSYDAVGTYEVSTTGIAAPAILGQDYDIVDKNGTVIQPTNGKYSITFSKAVQRTDTIYVKMLNRATAGTRTVDINIVANQQSEYLVDIFSTAFKRPVEIR
jgi:hypothetical protein